MLVETHMDGRPRGFAHITFGNVKDSVSAVVSATEEPMHLGGRDLVVNYARSKAESKRNLEPSEKLYFSGCREGEASLRTVLRDVEEDVRDIHFCAFFFSPSGSNELFSYLFTSARWKHWRATSHWFLGVQIP